MSTIYSIIAAEGTRPSQVLLIKAEELGKFVPLVGGANHDVLLK